MELFGFAGVVGALILVHLIRVHSLKRKHADEMTQRIIELTAEQARLRMEHLHRSAALALQYVRVQRASKAWKQAAKKWWKVANG